MGPRSRRHLSSLTLTIELPAPIHHGFSFEHFTGFRRTEDVDERPRRLNQTTSISKRCKDLNSRRAPIPAPGFGTVLHMECDQKTAPGSESDVVLSKNHPVVKLAFASRKQAAINDVSFAVDSVNVLGGNGR